MRENLFHEDISLETTQTEKVFCYSMLQSLLYTSFLYTKFALYRIAVDIKTNKIIFLMSNSRTITSSVSSKTFRQCFSSIGKNPNLKLCYNVEGFSSSFIRKISRQEILDAKRYLHYKDTKHEQTR